MQLKLTYFDMKGRGEPIRLTLYVGGVDFVDERISQEKFAEIKKDLPFGQLPVLTVDGKVLAQTRAIMRFCGRKGGLYPTDDWQAAKVDEVLDFLDDFVEPMKASFYCPEDKKKEIREKVVNEEWPKLFANTEMLLEKNGTGFFVGDTLTVADILAYCFFSWFTSGILDHVPTTLLEPYPKTKTLVEQVGKHPRVVEWNNKPR